MGKNSGLKFSTIVLIGCVFVVLNWLVLKFFAPTPVVVQTEQEITQTIKPSAPVVVRGEGYEFTRRGNRISNIKLEKYLDGGAPVELLGGENEFIEFGVVGADSAITIEPGENYITRIKVSGTGTPYARIVRGGNGDNTMLAAAGGVVNAGGQIKRESWSGIDAKGTAYDSSAFVGFEDQYWEVVVAPSAPGVARIKEVGKDKFQADITGSADYKIYAGAKKQDTLNAAAAEISGINRTMDYGWFSFLSRPFLWLLTELHKLFGNYGLAIIFLTLILRVLMIPLTKKSYKSMAAMQKMQPEMQRIQKLYADDKARLQKEMMALYAKSKANPMSGCLPMLLQIPIFFALYKALIIAVDMRNSDFLWIPDLASADPTSIFNLFGLLPFSPPTWLPVIGILPVLMGLSMWVQQKLSATASASSAVPGMQIMKWLPWIFVIMFAGLPAGLVLYWTISNLFGLAQQQYISRT
ncbi:MAG: membrane protein insertase YidC [Rickettsiales bacterium]|jgi:YidC/Oxa1 family membrane protein insertase|nr:membrane protein insertase YidC [Rickettsiales bacterium]